MMMRIVGKSLLVLAAVVWAGTATAANYAINMTTDYVDSTVLAPGDEVTVSLHLDAEPGLQLLSVAVIFEDDGILTYRPDLSVVPSQILPTPPPPAEPVTWVVPVHSPPIFWPVPPVGKNQINVDYTEASLLPASASGTDIWIGDLVFRVASVGDGHNTIELRMTSSNIIRANDVEVPSSNIGLSGSPINLITEVPVTASGFDDTTVVTEDDGTIVITGTDSEGQVLSEIILPPGTSVPSGEAEIVFDESGENAFIEMTGVEVPVPPGKSIRIIVNPGSSFACIVDSPDLVTQSGLDLAGHPSLRWIATDVRWVSK
jgi:hypothetical protein